MDSHCSWPRDKFIVLYLYCPLTKTDGWIAVAMDLVQRCYHWQYHLLYHEQCHLSNHLERYNCICHCLSQTNSLAAYFRLFHLTLTSVTNHWVCQLVVHGLGEHLDSGECRQTYFECQLGMTATWTQIPHQTHCSTSCQGVGHDIVKRTVQPLLEHHHFRVTSMLVDLVNELASLIQLLNGFLHSLCRSRNCQLFRIVSTVQFLKNILLPFLHHRSVEIVCFIDFVLCLVILNLKAISCVFGCLCISFLFLSFLFGPCHLYK